MKNIKFFYSADKTKTEVLLKLKDFEKLMEKLEDLQDTYRAYKIISKKYKTIPYEKLKAEIFDKNAKK